MTNSKIMKIIIRLILVIILSISIVHGQDIKIKNPALISGSTFGNIFQQYYKLGDYNSLLKLTSDSSIKKFGKANILEFYKRMQFGYSLKLKSWNRFGNIYQLNYQAKITANYVIVRMTVMTDCSDSFKIILPDKFWQQRYFLYK